MDARIDTHWKVRAFGKRTSYIELVERRIRRRPRGQKPRRGCSRIGESFSFSLCRQPSEPLIKNGCAARDRDSIEERNTTL